MVYGRSAWQLGVRRRANKLVRQTELTEKRVFSQIDVSRAHCSNNDLSWGAYNFTIDHWPKRGVK